MSIKQTQRKINFLPYLPGERAVKEEKKVVITVDVKNSVLRMGKHACEEMGMPGKFVKLYYDQDKKIIGWSVVNSSIGIEKLKSHKLVKFNAGGQFVVSIMTILGKMMGLEQTAYRLEVKKYVETQDMLDRGNTYFYVKISHENED